MAAATRSIAALVLRRIASDADTASDAGSDSEQNAVSERGFGGGSGRRAASGGRGGRGRKPGAFVPQEGSGSHGRRKRGSGLSAADRSPLGKAPDLDAIIARQRLGLPLAGRLREADVTRAWKLAAADHHPDRGGRHDTMQAVNIARDLLLGRGVD
ncbi:MAG: hypothetical protein RLZZ206_1080 [Cyanobacteriota bacterium]|jgi:hypothetical protein